MTVLLGAVFLGISCVLGCILMSLIFVEDPRSRNTKICVIALLISACLSALFTFSALS